MNAGSSTCICRGGSSSAGSSTMAAANWSQFHHDSSRPNAPATNRIEMRRARDIRAEAFLLQRLYEAIGLCDRLTHRGQQVLGLGLYFTELAADGVDRHRVEVVLEEQHLVLECLQHRIDRPFGPAHGPDHAGVAGSRLFQQFTAARTQVGAGIALQLFLPLGEQVLGDAFNRLDALAHRLGTIDAALVLAVQSPVGALQIAAVEVDHRAESLQRRLELLAGLVLRLAGGFHACLQDAALLDADRLQRFVLDGLAPSEKNRKHEAEYQPEMNSKTSHQFGLSFDRWGNRTIAQQLSGPESEIRGIRDTPWTTDLRSAFEAEKKTPRQRPGRVATIRPPQNRSSDVRPP